MIINQRTKFFDNKGLTYKIKDQIGQGSFGYVYKIIREIDKKTFALKTIPSEFPDEKVQKAFANESKLALQIKHENVIEYYFVHDGTVYDTLQPYIIMEFANQGTLKQLIDKSRDEGKFIENNSLIKIFHELIEGMEAINEKLIHRDIKPDNILINNNIIKISDFGLSKIVLDQTRTSTFKGFGHIKYKPPEGWLFDKNTIQMDIYSMGIVFFELATLQFPYKVVGEYDAAEWQSAHLYQNVPNPITINRNLSPIVAQIILKMLQKDTASRFKSWNEIKTAFQNEELPKSQFTSHVENALNKLLEVDQKKNEEKLKNEKRQNEITELNRIINYQFKEKIYNPIKNFSDEFNSKSINGSIFISNFMESSSKDIVVQIKLPNNNVDIKFQCLRDEDFTFKETMESGRGNYYEKIIKDIPRLNNGKIIGWGYIKEKNGIGYNIILVERNDEMYGEWYVLINTNNLVYGRNSRLPEPFCFEMDELRKEIKTVGITHIYHIEVIKLEIIDIIRFLSGQV